MNYIAVLGGLIIGTAYGYIAQRGAFCLNSGFRLTVTKRDFTKVKALFLAIAVQMLAMPAVFALGWAQPSFPAFFPVAHRNHQGRRLDLAAHGIVAGPGRRSRMAAVSAGRAPVRHVSDRRRRGSDAPGERRHDSGQGFRRLEHTLPARPAARKSMSQ